MTHRSILIIDDNDQLRAFLRQGLEHAGYSVVEASDGQKGLRQFRQSPTALVITDVLMPDGDGLEVTMAVRRESPTVKIIVLTGGSEEGDFRKVATLLGAHRAMRKPWRSRTSSTPCSRSYRKAQLPMDLDHKARAD